MEVQDHAYTHKTYDKVSTIDFTYKNEYIFRAILRHMGLQHKMTHSQAAKKWENMKKRYKELKNPPDGVKVFPEVCPYFSLMVDAMEGQLDGNAPILKTLPNDKDNSDFLSISKPKKRKVSMLVKSSTALIAGGPEVEVSLNVDEAGEEEGAHEGHQEMDCIIQEVEQKRNMMDSERQVIEREKQVMERERLVLQS
ncbi:hypothetical protein L3Q82_009391 [Scortum barcoo]|uniref:Uncharacterized protein n=1 Tax=Scortum barcoo TaxID=214431 RepID=A0ACB8WGW9_9TELE|nr:hypothetical protein L3Q82_009391 [Scortum barcoo]